MDLPRTVALSCRRFLGRRKAFAGSPERGMRQPTVRRATSASVSAGREDLATQSPGGAIGSGSRSRRGCRRGRCAHPAAGDAERGLRTRRRGPPARPAYRPLEEARSAIIVGDMRPGGRAGPAKTGEADRVDHRAGARLAASSSLSSLRTATLMLSFGARWRADMVIRIDVSSRPAETISARAC